MATEFSLRLHKIRWSFWFILYIFLCYSKATTAQTIPKFGFIGSKDAYYVGSLNQAVINQFIVEASSKKIQTLTINSAGGTIYAGILLANWILQNDVNVVIDRLCMSSCANYVFAAGKTKVIRPNALVVWHGGAEQKNFREMRNKYRHLHSLKLQGTVLSVEDAEFFSNNELGSQHWERQTKLQRDFYALTHIDEYITRVGQEPVNFEEAWTMSAADMKKFGLTDIKASEDYGSVEYVTRVSASTGLLTRPISLTIDEDRKVINLSEMNTK